MRDTYTTRYTLLERAKNQHDPKAWEEFIEAYKNYIYIIICTMNINEQDSQDIIQLVTIKLWKNLPTYTFAPKKHKFRNWVNRITRNEAISFIRRQKALAKKLNLAAQETALSYLNAVQHPEVDDIHENEWQIFITDTAMKRLESYFPSYALKAFHLYTKGIAVAEIAEEINVKERAVYKYISQAKSHLIDEIEQLKEEFSF